MSAIKSYEAMQNSIIWFRGVDLPTDPILHAVFSACSKQVPRPICRTPAWNLDVIFKALVPPFEPINHVEFEHENTVIVALATTVELVNFRLPSRLLFRGPRICGKD